MSTETASVRLGPSQSAAVAEGRRRRPRWAVPAAAVLAVCASALFAGPAWGEGSVNFNTGANSTWGRSPLLMYGDARPNAADKNRYSVLRVYARAGETVQLGSSAMGLVAPGGIDGSDNILVYPPGTSFASSTDPSARAPFPGDPVFSSDIFDCNADDPGTGRIASRAQEVAGPAPNPGGYTPCEFIAPADGIYPVVMAPFNPAANAQATSIGTPVTSTSQGSTISIWDVTVRNAGGVVQPGRLFSNRLALHGSPTAPFGSQPRGPFPVSFIYTPTGYLYRVSLFDHDGQDWELAVNDRGVVDATSGERIFASFVWGDGPGNVRSYFDAQAPQITDPDLAQDSRFPIFFNEPDPVAISGAGGLGPMRGYASSPIAPSGALSDPSFTGSAGEAGATMRGSSGTIRFDSPTQMAGLGYKVEIDLNQNGTLGDAGDVVDDTQDLDAAGRNEFSWNGQAPGGGDQACGSYAYRVSATMAEVHLTMSDVEQSGGTQIERLSLPSDAALGDPFSASYNDIDPYKNTAVTDASPVAVNAGTSGPTFHAWTTDTGNADYVDTWMRLPEVSTSGTLEVRCAPPPSQVPPPGQVPPGQVSIDKRASDRRVVVGDMITYRLVAKNNGAGQADGVVVDDHVPSELDVRGASSTQGDCAVSGNRVRCELGTLASGQEATVTVRAVAIKAGQSTNTGIVLAAGCPPEGCDTDPAQVMIVKPKLRVSKTASKRHVRAGNTVAYAIRVTNPSKAAVRNVRTCDLMPAGLVPVDATPKLKLSNGRYCWTAKRLRAGKSKTYQITVRALPGAAGRTVNRATASSPAVQGTARAARAVRVLGSQAAGGGVTG